MSTAPGLRRPSVPVWLPAVAGVVLVVALVVGGGAPQAAVPGIPDPGPVTGWGRRRCGCSPTSPPSPPSAWPSRRPCCCRHPPGELRGERARDASGVVWASLAVALGAALQIPLTVSNVLAVPPGEALDRTLLSQFVTQTDLGRALAAQVIIATVTAGTALLVDTAAGACWLLVLTLAALAPQALTGHSASGVGHSLAVASLLVPSCWPPPSGPAACGARVAARRGVAGLRFAVPRFSALAPWCFVAVAVSGVVNAGVRLGSVSALFGCAYGGLVLAKAGALLVRSPPSASGTGSGSSRRSRPASGPRARTVRRRLRAFGTLAVAELAVMAGTFGLAVALGRTPTPPAQPCPLIPAPSCSASRCRPRRP